ncbi:SDR family oxidoreductase [Boseaceae bacterium BT-24-1]|nr:SDR family oxidoreductase [Boseaceae bacterium BT-24-1]
MRILLTGADGYIGAILGPKLVERGFDAIGLDTGFYRRGWLFDDRRTRPNVITRDVRQVSVEDLRGFDAVLHLAELSNDPLAAQDPEITFAINHRASVNLARMCRDAKVARFIYASSCSIYGAGSDQKTEESAPQPLTAYAQCKVLVERDVANLRDEHFTPVFLRNATAFGASPRQRFDLVLNNLCGWAWTIGEIRMTSDGTPWRPFVHIEDIADAMICALEAPLDAVAGEALNVGVDSQNYQAREIAEVVAGAFPGCGLTIGDSSGDDRSYRASFAKIRDRLPAFRCRWSVERGAEQFRRLFDEIGFTKEMFHAAPYTRLSELQHLRSTGQLSSNLHWTSSDDERAQMPSRYNGHDLSLSEIAVTGSGQAMEKAGSSNLMPASAAGV